jgi:hypothetical protein
VIVYLKSKYVWLRSIASLLLLFGYFLNVISFESFHQAVHNHDHAEIHTEEAEADACHRAIFHGEVSHNCEHKSHLVETESECQLCDVVVSRVHFASASESVLNRYTQYTVNTPASARFFGYDFTLAFAPRGPPARS